MDRVKGKVAIVTGGALGIGRSACRLLAREGAKVAVTDILNDKGNDVVKEIKTAGGTAEYRHLNVADEAEVAAVFKGVKERFGKIDVLANNAGISGVNKPTDEIAEQEWDHRVNSIHPGYIWTPMVENFVRDNPMDAEELLQTIHSKHPIGSKGETDDIGWAIVYLASEEAKFIAGSELVIDRGYTAQ